MVPVDAHSRRCGLRPGGGERLPARTGEQAEILLVGDLGAGDGDLAAQALERRLVRAGALGQAFVDGLVDHAVDPAEEEAGDAVHPGDVAPTRLQRLQAGDVGLGHLEIGVDAEEQGDVDVDAVGDQLADRRNALGGARHLDHHVGPIDRPPQPPRLDQARLGVEAQVGRDLEADEAVLAPEGVVKRTQHVGGGLDVLDRDPLVEIDHVGVGHRQHGFQLIVVVRRLPDGLFEDRPGWR